MKFQDLDRSDAKKFFDWFQEQIQTRTDVLALYIHSTPGFENWEKDFSPQSLEILGTWFCQQVTTKKRSEKEIEDIYSKAPDWFKTIQVPDVDISAVTVSISVDIAMYLSQVMQKNVAGLQWKLITSPRSSVNYHQPVLAGKGKMVFNPINIIVTYAYGIIRGSKGPERLRELYDIWANILVNEH